MQNGKVFHELLTILGIQCGNSLNEIVEKVNSIGCGFITVKSVEDCVSKMNLRFLASLKKWSSENEK